MDDLHKTTLDLLNVSEIPLPEIAKGAEVGYRWLCDLKNGRFTDPGIKKIQRIYSFLCSKQAPGHELQTSAHPDVQVHHE
ncbi:hypothetical protein LG204_10165 [Methylovorus menthalis]|uniref:hypothetical protein n=1 Tax=Methylovorus menthalis TaxID=1002227 RepID=UPI001E5CC849|nr:hypothetical protein [Methylovorus menthalis]MCB4811679.1 hypothetical protein [Methylovorus menthalis]